MINFLFTKTPLVFMIQSFWRDEAFSALLASRNILDIIYLTAKDFNPPLYYIIIHFWIKIFGSSEIALRSFSLICYWATIYVIYLFLSEIIKVKNILILTLCLIIAITNPLLIYYAFEARMYTLFAFLSTLSIYSLITSKKKLFFISNLLNFYTHYFSFFIFFIEVSYIFYFEKNKNIKFKKNFYFSWPLIFYLPWIIFIFFNHPGSTSFWIKKIELNEIWGVPFFIYTGYEKGFNFYNRNVNYFNWFFLIIFLLVGFQWKRLKKEKKFLLFLLWGIICPFFIFIFSFFIKPLFLPRYLIIFNTGLLLFLFFLFTKLPKKTSLFIIFCLLYLNFNYNIAQITGRKKTNLKKAIYEIKAIIGRDDVIYVISELDFHVAQYYFDEEKVYIYDKKYEEIPNYVGKILIPKSKIRYELPTYPKKTFILYSNGEYEIQSQL